MNCRPFAGASTCAGWTCLGSAARGDFEPDRSDIDLLVEFDHDLREAFSLRTYLGLKEALEELLGRSVDLVES